MPGQEFASLGFPVRGLRICIADGDRPLPESEVGELQLCGPIVCSGYLGNAEAMREAFTADGWFRTGDLGFIKDGRLTLAGRSKESIVVNGVNHFPQESEAAVEKLHGVERSYTAAFPTRPSGSDTEQLVIVFSAAAEVNDDHKLHRLIVAIRNAVLAECGFRPSLILPLPPGAVPKTSIGKIQRSLVQTTGGGRLRGAPEAHRRRDPVANSAAMHRPSVHGNGPGRNLRGRPRRSAGDDHATASFFEWAGRRLTFSSQAPAGRRGSALATFRWRRSCRGRRCETWPAASVCSPSRARSTTRSSLQPNGSETPLFCVHPGVGEVLVFVGLALYFVNERPMDALRVRLQSRRALLLLLRGDGAKLCPRTLRHAAEGTVCLAGILVRRRGRVRDRESASERGECVEFLGLIDVPPHIRANREAIDLLDTAASLAFLLSLISKEQAVSLPTVLRQAGSRRRKRWRSS